MEDIYKIKLPVFEGPLDLLLHLIRDNKIDIYDIPIAFITHRYLEYIKMMKELDLEIAGEFLVMAATLIYIKSRVLLPPDEDAAEDETEDPRLELVHRLLEYQTYKDGASILRERESEWQNIFAREQLPDDEEHSEPAELSLMDINIFDLLGAFKKILDMAPDQVITITREALTIKDKIALIVESIENQESMRFEDLFKSDVTKQQLIVTFLALLEILRLGLARVYQEKEFGNIWIINPQKKNAEGAEALTT